jgi:uncharacterized protein (TIGR03067 family)
MRPRLLIATAAVLLLGLAPAPLPRRDRPAGEDPHDVGGTWEFVACELGGRPYGSTGNYYRAEITRDQFRFAPKEGGVATTYAMRLYPQETPPAFTLSMDGAVHYVGSYRLKNGRLTLIFTSGRRLDRRPTNFEGRTGWRYVLRRVRL